MPMHSSASRHLRKLSKGRSPVGHGSPADLLAGVAGVAPCAVDQAVPSARYEEADPKPQADPHQEVQQACKGERGCETVHVVRGMGRAERALDIVDSKTRQLLVSSSVDQPQA